MIGKVFVFVLASLVASESFSAATSNFVCYYGSWAKYRPNNGGFGIPQIDLSHCTHLIYSFVGLNADGTVKSLDEWKDYNSDYLNAFTALKTVRSDVKVLLAIGGWEHSTTFPAVAASPALRAVFLQSTLDFIQKYNFDGFDFDWEYPGQRGGSPQDVKNFATLCKEFKAAFEPRGLILTAAVSATATSVAISYDVPAISQHLDMINVMAYDLHGSWDGVTGHNAPLYASSKDTTAAALQLNVEACISNWIAQGAAPSKINMGIPLYGRTFTLASTADVSLGAASIGPGTKGPHTQEAGYLGYNEIIEKINEGGWTYAWDNEQQVPHMYKGDQWVGFDDPTSVALKVKLAQSKQLGGVMVWSIEVDDFHGLSGTKNPLLSAITTQLAAGSSSETTKKSKQTTAAPATTKAAPATTKAAPAATTAAPAVTTGAPAATTAAPAANNGDTSAICNTTGFVRLSSDCNKFYQCTEDSTGNLVANEFSCNAGLYFDTRANVCNWPGAVPDC